ncbi:MULTISPECIES: ABC transporter substrate-binding protein [Thalassobaculum]|uniref:Amino acid/amide ABC transporter substrate-binding protein, HAAT family n=1 Tax=Thalassobaculum litoreum DSM 18839 TaxID=1123362 RepID=A0A8G2F3L8_9PROT|nr:MULTISPECIES: ABC transporter substrate-binding protein [Thalassobaculum]SDF93059.1 amino acid/amide ABC transporter substrate-binding protein, HAAT family [Thalassobaculum litoreum DSM 18839]
MNFRSVTMTMAAAAVGLFGLTGAAQAEGQFIPNLVYKTGPYAPSGTPTAHGFADYLAMVNHRDGGINGVEIIYEECETGYKTDRGVECYDRVKNQHGGATVINPWSTGITYALIEKATADKIPLLSMGYGRTSAADGRVFPYVFNFPSTYWNQMTAVIKYIAEQEGGYDKLKGQNLGFIYLDHPYGKEPIPTLDILAEKYGFTYDKYPVPPAAMTEQKSIWLQVRRARPAYMIMWGWGAMNSTAINEASNVKYPMEKFIGNWWAAAEPDVIPAGDGAIGYKGATFNGVGTDFKVYEDINALYDAGKGSWNREEIGGVLYSRGMAAAAYVVEAIRTAQAEYGNRVITGEEMRWGMENLDVTDARIEELGMTGLMPPVSITCDNHEGQNPAIKIQQWNGKEWEIKTDWIKADTALTRPLIEQDAEQYAKESSITPRSCS